jgi:hypothetical protein
MRDASYEFSTIIEAPDDALDWLAEKLGFDSVFNEDCWNDGSLMIGRDDDVMQISTYDNCPFTKISFLVENVCEMQIKFDLDEPWHLTWAFFWVDGSQWYICGDAVVCFKGVTNRPMSLIQWVEETEANLLESDGMSASEKSGTDMTD